MPFLATNYSSIASLVQAHDHYLSKELLAPVLRTIHKSYQSIKSDFDQLRSTFLGKPLTRRNPPPDLSQFSCESEKKQVAEQLRRYNIGSQARGLHFNLRQAQTEEEHLRLALQAPHPTVTAHEALEDHWQFVFDNLREAFQLFGVAGATQRLISYRRKVCEWLTKLQLFVAPLQKRLNQSQPPGPASVSGHVQSVFFYILLLLTQYSNPLFAFKFFHGAPLVGLFESNALRAREKIQGPFSDEAILKTARDCERHS